MFSRLLFLFALLLAVLGVAACDSSGYHKQTGQSHHGHPSAGADAATFVIDESYIGLTDAPDRSGVWSDGQRVAVAK